MKTALLILAIIINSCSDEIYSNSKYENGVILDKIYTPKISDNSPNVGISTSGDLHIGITSIDVDEKYTLLIKCNKHNEVFAINNKKLYGSVNKGDSITIEYKEILEIDKKDTIVTDYKFINIKKR